MGVQRGHSRMFRCSSRASGGVGSLSEKQDLPHITSPCGASRRGVQPRGRLLTWHLRVSSSLPQSHARHRHSQIRLLAYPNHLPRSQSPPYSLTHRLSLHQGHALLNPGQLKMSGAQGANPPGAFTDTMYASAPGVDTQATKSKVDSTQDEKGLPVELAADSAPNPNESAGLGGPVFGGNEGPDKGVLGSSFTA